MEAKIKFSNPKSVLPIPTNFYSIRKTEGTSQILFTFTMYFKLNVHHISMTF